MFHFYFERKNDKALAFNIVHVHNFEISASLISAANRFQYVISGTFITRNTLPGKRILNKTKFSFVKRTEITLSNFEFLNTLQVVELQILALKFFHLVIIAGSKRFLSKLNLMSRKQI